MSLELIKAEAACGDAALTLVDAGGGMSSLALDLVRGAIGRPVTATVVDISGTALEASQARAAPEELASGAIAFQVSDILELAIPPSSLDVWHDRAVFHFLTDPSDQEKYVALVSRAVKPLGIAVMATFDEDGGPTRCSDLDVQRWTAPGLAAAFGEAFDLVRSEKENHVTPTGRTQKFVYAVLRRKATEEARE
jgi:ubiquinone/menaquinone biosynthesis C-methylase UbiE